MQSKMQGIRDSLEGSGQGGWIAACPARAPSITIDHRTGPVTSMSESHESATTSPTFWPTFSPTFGAQGYKCCRRTGPTDGGLPAAAACLLRRPACCCHCKDDPLRVLREGSSRNPPFGGRVRPRRRGRAPLSLRRGHQADPAAVESVAQARPVGYILGSQAGLAVKVLVDPRYMVSARGQS